MTVRRWLLCALTFVDVLRLGRYRRRARFTAAVGVGLAVVLMMISLGERRADPAVAGTGPTAGFDQGDSKVSGREVEQLDTATATTYALADGGFAVVASASPIRFKDSSGNWEAIGTNLVSDSSGAHNEANGFSIHLPADLSSSVKIAQGDDSLEFALEDAKASLTTKGSTATYSDAFPGLKVEYTSTPTGLEESLVLGSPAAAFPPPVTAPTATTTTPTDTTTTPTDTTTTTDTATAPTDTTTTPTDTTTTPTDTTTVLLHEIWQWG